MNSNQQQPSGSSSSYRSSRSNTDKTKESRPPVLLKSLEKIVRENSTPTFFYNPFDEEYFQEEVEDNIIIQEEIPHEAPIPPQVIMADAINADVALLTAKFAAATIKLATHLPDADPPVLLPKIDIQIMIEDTKRYLDRLEDIETRSYRHFDADTLPDQVLVLQNLVSTLNDIRSRAAQILEVYNQNEKLTQSTEKRPVALPTFDGKYENWSSFKDRFDALIDRDKSLAPSVKLQHLQGCIVVNSEPYALVMSHSITNENYKIAYDELIQRYDKKKEIFYSLFRKILKLPVLENQRGLLHMIDTVNHLLLKIKNMFPNIDGGEPYIVSIVFDRLDFHSKREVERHFSGNDVPKLKDLLDFLLPIARSYQSMKHGNNEVKINSEVKHNDNHINNPKSKGRKFRGAKQASSSNESSTSVQATKTTPNPNQNTYTPPPCVFCSDPTHRLYGCEKFKGKPLAQRQKFVNEKGLCYNCFGKHQSKECQNKFSCRHCKKRHNSLLCETQPVVAQQSTEDKVESPPHSLLKTATLLMMDKEGRYHKFRGLLDSGAQSNFVTERCARFLQLSRTPTQTKIVGVAGTSCGKTQGQTEVQIQSPYNSSFTMTIPSLILQKVSVNLPQQSISSSIKWHHLEFLQFSDPTYRESGKIDFILGADVCNRIRKDGFIKGSHGEPCAHQTELGWVVSGAVAGSKQNELSVLTCTNEDCYPDFDLTRFFNQEEFLSPHAEQTEDQQAEQNFADTHHRDQEGRYVAELPFRRDGSLLGHSRKQARSRFVNKETSLLKQPERYDRFQEHIQQLWDAGIIEEIPADQIPKRDEDCYYLPYHGVEKESSTTTKLRIVFDASAKTTSGISLNDILLTGPILQPDLVNILMQFRTYEIAMTADIEKMFLQVAIAPKHRDFLRILWRPTPLEPIREFRFTRLPFGLSCSLFLAIRVIHQLVQDEGVSYPEAAKILIANLYVDDKLSGGKTKEKSLLIRSQAKELLSKGCFNLTKWMSSSPEVMQAIPPEDSAVDFGMELEKADSVKTLGVSWHPIHDVFFFIVNIAPQEKYTKRDVVSIIARIYDPLGWLQPVILLAKLVIQQIAMSNIHWKEMITPEIAEKWTSLLNELPAIQDIKIPRRVYLDGAELFEIHMFADASKYAHGAVVYLRTKYLDGSFTSRLIISKSKVTPKKLSTSIDKNPNSTIPKLELNAAVLGVELVEMVKRSMDIPIEKCFYWSDSSITLWRLQNLKTKSDLYVRNRIAKILQYSKPEQWNYVKTDENPADVLSRGINASQLQYHPLWWRGPLWLSSSSLPLVSIPGMPSILEEQTIGMITTTPPTQFKYQKYETFQGLLRASALIQRAFNNKRDPKMLPPLTVLDLQAAENSWIRRVQSEYFPDEIDRLKKSKPLKVSSKLIAFSPFLDEKGILRVGGRLSKSQLPEDAKHQILLPKESRFTHLLIRHTHYRLLHAGPHQVRATLLQKYRIIHAREAVKKVISECLICFRFTGKPAQQLMGDLPAARVNPVRVFSSTGVDFGGPIPIKLSFSRATRNRPESHGKGWICLFICMWSKTIHLELVTGLSTEQFLKAFERFIARRGKPDHMYSDNGTNFVGADNEMKEFQDFIQSSTTNQQIQQTMNQKRIQWHLNPPAAPHQGGYWEAGIKSTKYHMKRVIGDSVFCYEDLSTILVNIEAVLNSRPLWPLEADQNDHYPLTPAHFTIGEPMTALPQESLSHLPNNRLDAYQKMKLVQQHFRERWSKEYLMEIQKRSKWNKSHPNLKVGQRVLLVDNLKPSLKWETGQIIEVEPGTDKRVRSVKVKTDSGIYRRPIVKVIPYPTGKE